MCAKENNSETISRIADYENLMWAWHKAKNAYKVEDIWFDTLELADFEANACRYLLNIQKDILDGVYQMNPIKPLPYPKCAKELDDGSIEKKVRQTFYVSVRDQVAWLAVVNIIGPDLDFQMPFWSYGNRLYHSSWYEEEVSGGKVEKVLHSGWYRSSIKSIYRKWNQSWPLFRHTISLTIKKMSNTPKADYSDNEDDMERNNERLPNRFKARYLEDQYWNIGDDKITKLFWAGIDFEKFYPSVKIGSVVQNILKNGKGLNGDADFEQLLIQLTTFKVSVDNAWSKDDIDAINLYIDDESVFRGIPTGLHVAGFLANAALIEVDKAVAEKLERNRMIAHFRYVDDHVILSYNFDDLCKWINEYEKLIIDSHIGASINIQKTEPQAMGNYLNGYCYGCEQHNDDCALRKKAENSSRLDPDFPSPLVTQTLAKVSATADCDMDFLTEHEERQLISDLEHLLITDFPDHELKGSTRISFAANRLSMIMQRKRADYSKVYEIRKEMFRIAKEIETIGKKNEITGRHVRYLITKHIFDNTNAGYKPFPDDQPYSDVGKKEIAENETKMAELYSRMKDKVREIKNNESAQKLHVFALLVKAAKENHDKLKLWSRLFDYCYNTGISSLCGGINNLLSILDAIDNVHENGRSHNLSNHFLISQFVLLLSDRLVDALFTLKNNTDHFDKENAKCFIDACLDKTLLSKLFAKKDDSNMKYYKTSFKYLRMTLGTARYVIGSDVALDYDLLDWADTPKEWCNEHNVDIDEYLSYLMYRLNDKKAPDCFDKRKWEFMAGKSQNPNKFLDPFNHVGAVAPKSDTHDDITLYDWIQKCSEWNKDSKYIYDPRLSEWMALKIVERLIDIHQPAEDLLEFDLLYSDKKISTCNYYLPKEWADHVDVKSWSYYKSLCFDKIDYRKEDAIDDVRYTPQGLKKVERNRGDFDSIYGFAVILSQLISHNTEFPWIWNVEDKNMELPNYIFANTGDLSMSSFSKAILLGSTLSRSRESFRINMIFDELKIEGISDDTNNDPPRIALLSEMRHYIQRAIVELEKLQISVGDSEPRQMIPVRLERITKSQSF